MVYDILVIDDEKDIRGLICDILNDSSYTTRSAKNSTEALTKLDDKVPSAVVLDIWLQGSELDGLGILEIIKKKHPYIPVIIISGHGTIETAVNSIKLGAYDYIEKPFTEDRLLVLVNRACEMARLQRENVLLKSQPHQNYEFLGKSAIAKQLQATAKKVAPSLGRILITGPSGSGKKLLAQMIHNLSPRKNEPFVIFDATGMSADKAEAELFGEGSSKFIDAPRKVGILELANCGTLFIDEISDLPQTIQNKLLRFLQTQSFVRPGSDNPIKIDIRIISASSKNLENEMKKGKLREDLFYRLNVVPITIPPLSKRKEDIPELCMHFLDFYTKNAGFTQKRITEDAIVAMQTYSWPGNIRQLRNVIEWLLIMTDDKEEINSKMLPPEIISGSKDTSTSTDTDVLYMSLREAREKFEKQYLKAQKIRFNSNISRMASAIGMERSALHRKMKSLEVVDEDS